MNTNEYQVLTSNAEELRRSAKDFNLTIEYVVEEALSRVFALKPNTNYVVFYGLYCFENLPENVYRNKGIEVVPMGCGYGHGCVYVVLRLLEKLELNK